MCSAWWNVINVDQIRIGVRGWNLFSHVWLKSCRGSLTSLVLLVWWWMKYFNHWIPKGESGNTVHASTCTKRNHLSFCRPVWNRSLFLAHPAYWYKRVTSENAQESSWCWFWVFEVSRKIRVVKQFKCASLCCASRITMLSVINCVMNVRDQTCQSFVTWFYPFRYRTCKFVNSP